MLSLWNLLLVQPLLNSLMGVYHLTGNLGWSIILLTLALRFLLTPLILPSLKISRKVQELAPELAKLKEKYKDNKTAFITAQAELYKQHGANPAAGCLPQIAQLLILIALFNVLNSVLRPNGSVVDHLNPLLYSFLKLPSDFSFSTHFFYLDLLKPDTFSIPGVPFPLPGVFLLLSALVQLISSKMMSPVVTAEKKVASKTPQSSDDAMVEAQQQMLFMFPLMTLIFGLKFPAGLVLYWLVFSGASAVQQYRATGWGGLAPWIRKLKFAKIPDNR